MNILGIDASGIAGSIAYIKDNKLIGEYYICHKLTHSETIMPMLEHLKNLIGLELNTLDAIAVTSGPGSFTGLRIGVTTAKALALALDIPVIGVPTLDVMAYNITYTPDRICPIMDARRNQVYTASYKWQDKELLRLMDYNAIDLDELLQELGSQNERIIFLGDAVWQYRDKIEAELGDNAAFAPSYLNLQRAGVLVDIAQKEYEKGNTVSASDFVPMYLRKSQAEREREARIKNAD
ncbi:tRNA (adenosine(37)-N6)-threonylcarbamoyltransferase complex dimerization subunit type 1 TsaB [Cellulosilyticum sp. I15G10I2]|uniref:tRNA (adenosine(37)-N6)-threonylcarbamoyltransferase complex dimerization subunit type 1 TsaB n=1 Tax=Cellulosilyticum sp. I15G10I2 TaxID=1892843 RepID=UPI00085C8E3F|nr:tRNA (adenosine(37)-N6)-threonylcarbamoyltransferase complex dimerization subunit type 1 TsaB [Cellulosilyticum sp. I15G10I2]